MNTLIEKTANLPVTNAVTDAIAAAVPLAESAVEVIGDHLSDAVAAGRRLGRPQPGFVGRHRTALIVGAVTLAVVVGVAVYSRRSQGDVDQSPLAAVA